MIDTKTRVLITTVQKLHRRGAKQNIKKILAKTHIPDIAAVLEELEANERRDIFLMEENAERRAEILSYLGAETQTELSRVLNKGEILKIVSLMDSDDAADLLGRMDPEASGEILNAMVKEDSEDVADLMGYPEDSAGGLMSSDYLALSKQLTVGEAIKEIQNQEDDALIAFYVYVVNEHDQLLGVLSLKNLILSKPHEVLGDIMGKDVISVTTDTPQDEVARLVEKYDFLSLPVVGTEGELVGVITVDDVIDVIREEAEEDLLAMGRAGWSDDESLWGALKSRFPWVLLTFIGGALCYGLIAYATRDVTLADGGVTIWSLVAAFTPMILSMGATVGNQSATVAVGAIRSGQFDNLSWRSVLSHLWTELGVALMLGLLFGSLVIYAGYSLLGQPSLGLVMGGALFLLIVFAKAVATFIPITLHRFGIDPTVASVALYGIIADISAVALLYGMTYFFLGS